MPGHSRNDIRIQCITDSRTVATIAKYFDTVGVTTTSVSDLVRKALQTLATSVLDHIDHIPSTAESHTIIQDISQRGSGFGNSTPYIHMNPNRLPHQRSITTNEKKIEDLMNSNPTFTREKAIKHLAAMDEYYKITGEK